MAGVGRDVVNQIIESHEPHPPTTENDNAGVMDGAREAERKSNVELVANYLAHNATGSGGAINATGVGSGVGTIGSGVGAIGTGVGSGVGAGVGTIGHANNATGALHDGSIDGASLPDTMPDLSDFCDYFCDDTWDIN